VAEEHYAYLLVEDAKWWNRRTSKNRLGSDVHSFVRKGKVGPKVAQQLLFYVKSPVKQIKGAAEFLERITGTSDELWQLYGQETVFESREQYDSFVAGSSTVTFIRFKNMEELQNPVDFNTISVSASISRMPQGGKYLGRETVSSMIKTEMKQHDSIPA
jgi:predicted transcriptional regulator